MRFLIDAQLPPKLAAELRRSGHRADHVNGIGMVTASDGEIWNRAGETGAAVITKDGDFAARRRSAVDGPPVVWIRFGNTTAKALAATFLPRLAEIVDALNDGEVLVEVR